MKRRITALFLAAVLVLAGIGMEGRPAGAASLNDEESNLKLANEAMQSVQTVAGRKIHVAVDLYARQFDTMVTNFIVSTAKDGKEDPDSYLTISNVKASMKGSSWSSAADNWFYLEKKSTNSSDRTVRLEYDITVSEYAKIGTYNYYITYEDEYENYTPDELELITDYVPAGNLKMEVAIVGEKMPATLSIVSEKEFSANAGDTVSLVFTLKNEGEIKAMNTYISLTGYDTGLNMHTIIPDYTPLKQKIGDIAPGEEKTVTLAFRIDEKAKTERIPITIIPEYKYMNGEIPGNISTSTIYLSIAEKEEEKKEPRISFQILNNNVAAKPGESVEQTVTIRNTGDTAVLVKAFPDFKRSPIGIVSGEGNDMPLLFLQASDTQPSQMQESLEPNQERQFTIAFTVPGNGSKYYYGKMEVPIVVQYALKDDKEKWQLYSDFCLNLNLKEEENIFVGNFSQSPEEPLPGEEVTVMFYIENPGSKNITDVKVRAMGLSDSTFEPISTELYKEVGTIPAGKKVPVELVLRVGKNNASTLNTLKLEYTFKDSNGMEHSGSQESDYILIGEKASSTLLIGSFSQSPAEPVAGQNMTVSFYLENPGDKDITDVKVRATGLSDATFEPVNSEMYQKVGTIAAGTKKRVEIVLKVGENNHSTLNALNLEYTFKDSKGIEHPDNTASCYILNVKRPPENEKKEEPVISRPKLMISNFYTDVEEVKAGNVFDFTFEILNTNESIRAKNIKLTVTSSGSFSVTAGGNSFFVAEIKPGESVATTINLKASAASTTGAYPINVKMEYEYDGIEDLDTYKAGTYTGEVVTEELLLQVKENLRPSVQNIYIGSWEVPMVNQSTTMNFEFYNMGKSTLNNTYVTVSGDFMLANGSSSYYIGNIAAGMPEHVEFDVIPLVEGTAVGIMTIHMEDSNGDEVTMDKEFTAEIMGEGGNIWYDPGFDPGVFDPVIPADSDNVKKPILPLWIFLAIQAGILVVVIPVTRAIRLAAYRRKIRKEDEAQ